MNCGRLPTTESTFTRARLPGSAYKDRAMPPAYRFVDRWVVPTSIERVYDAIGDVLAYERWWTDFVLRSTGDEAPPAPGKSNELLVKAYLPYKVNFGLEVLEAERPRRILSRLSKD